MTLQAFVHHPGTTIGLLQSFSHHWGLYSEHINDITTLKNMFYIDYTISKNLSYMVRLIPHCELCHCYAPLNLCTKVVY